MFADGVSRWQSGRIKKPVLIDFGSAKFLEPQTVTVTTTINRRFTPYEQEEGGNPQPNWDVYGLAATLYFVVTGEKPQSSISCKLSRDRLIPPQQHCSDLSDRLNKAILKGMALEAKNRPPSMKSWLKLLLPHQTLLNKAIIQGMALESLARSYLKPSFPFTPLCWLIIGYLPTGILIGMSGSNIIQSESESIAVFIAAIVIAFLTFFYHLIEYDVSVAIAVSAATFILIKITGTIAVSWAIALAVTFILLLFGTFIDYYLSIEKYMALALVGALLSGAISGYFTKMGAGLGLTCGFMTQVQFYTVLINLSDIDESLKKRYRPIQVLLITGISSTLGLMLGGGIGWYLRIVGIFKV